MDRNVHRPSIAGGSAALNPKVLMGDIGRLSGDGGAARFGSPGAGLEDVVGDIAPVFLDSGIAGGGGGGPGIRGDAGERSATPVLELLSTIQ